MIHPIDKVVLAGAVMWIGFAGLQFNDPDPLAWITCYGFTAGYTLAAYRRRLPTHIALMWGVLMLVIATTLFASHGLPPEGAEGSTLGPLADETNREIGGLVMIGLWMGFLAWKTPPQSAKKE